MSVPDDTARPVTAETGSPPPSAALAPNGPPLPDTDTISLRRLGAAVIGKAIQDLHDPKPPKPRLLALRLDVRPKGWRTRYSVVRYQRWLRQAESAAQFLSGGPDLDFWCLLAGMRAYYVQHDPRLRQLIAAFQGGKR